MKKFTLPIYVMRLLGLAGSVALLGLGSCAHGPDGRNDAPDIGGTPRQMTDRAKSYAHYLAAIVYERQNRYQHAVAEMRKAADLVPEAVSPTLRLVRAYLRLGDYENAMAMCERAVEQRPDNPKLRLVLGEIYHRLERHDDAVESYKKAIELDPDSSLGYGALYDLEETTNDLVAAIDICKRLIEIRPKNPLLHYQLGLSLARIDDYPAAADALEKALELALELHRARFILGVVYLELAEDEKAAEQFGAVVDKDPGNLRARENLAAALARLEDYEAAAEQLIEVLERGGDARHALETVYLLLRAGRYERASRIVPPTGAPILGTLLHALARKQMGTPYEAIVESLDTLEGNLDAECTDCLNEILYLFGKQATAAYWLDQLADIRSAGIRSRTIEVIRGRILINLERYSEAERVLQGVLNEFGADKDLHYYLATVYESLGRFAATERHLKAYLEIDPDDPDVLNFLGYLYAEHNTNLGEAEKLLKKALEIDPDNGYYLDSLGWIYYRMGDAERAIELIRKAVLQMDTDDAELRDHLGDAYLLKGDVENALEEWERAHRLDPSREGVKKKIERYKKE